MYQFWPSGPFGGPEHGGPGLSKTIVIPKDLLRNPVGRRLSLRLTQPLG